MSLRIAEHTMALPFLPLALSRWQKSWNKGIMCPSGHGRHLAGGGQALGIMMAVMTSRASLVAIKRFRVQ